MDTWTVLDRLRLPGLWNKDSPLLTGLGDTFHLVVALLNSELQSAPAVWVTTALPSVAGGQSNKTAAFIETEKNYQQNVSEGKPMLSLLAKLHTTLKMYQSRPGNLCSKPQIQS